MVPALRLGTTYEADLWDLHKCVFEARRSNTPLLFITLQAPITSEAVDIAIESGSLYLAGIRTRSGWFEFQPDTEKSDPHNAGPATPRLPASRWIAVGGQVALATYRALRLVRMVRDAPGATGQIGYADRPADLLRFFATWDGSLSGHHARLSVCVLIFIVCEALRFRSIETICADWVWHRGLRNHAAQAGGVPIGPAASELGQIDAVLFPAFTITSEMLDIVQNWRAKAMSPDVWTRPPDLPDPLIS